MIRSVKVTLFSLPKLRVYATVNLWDTRNKEPSWYSVFHGNTGSYLTFTPTASLTLKYLKEKVPGTDDWSRQEQIYLTNKTIGGFKQDLKSFYARFQRPNLFEYDENNIPVSLNRGKRDIVVIPFDSGQVCTFEPAILVNVEQKIYPGVIFRINVKAYSVEMSVWEFESFYDLIQNIQLYEVGMQILQLYLSMNRSRSDATEPQPVTSNPYAAKVLFEQTEEQDEESITSNAPVIKSPTSLDELGGI